MPKNFRKKKVLEEDNEEEEQVDKDSLEDTRLRQKQRERVRGLSTTDLMAAPASAEEPTAAPAEEEVVYGLRIMKEESSMPGGEEVEQNLTQLSATFTTQSEATEVDTHMLQYIETQLKKKRGDEDKADAEQRARTEEEDLYKIPENLQAQSNIADDNAGAWLTGIVEVSLPIEFKLKNIEATELAKRKMLEEKKNFQKNVRSVTSHAIPQNFNANFAQHRRANYEAAMRRQGKPIEERGGPSRPPVHMSDQGGGGGPGPGSMGDRRDGPPDRGGGPGAGPGAGGPGPGPGPGHGGPGHKRSFGGPRPEGVETATDEVVLDRFKQNFRRLRRF